MTKMDIKNYLEKIYKVPVHNVRTQIKLTNNEQPGKTFIEEMTQKNFLPIDPVRDKMKMSVKWSEEYKEAVVVLGEGQTFKFPDIESSIAENERDKQLDNIQKTMEGSGRSQKEVEEKRAKDMRRQGIPGWFS
ncbi:hypothetical protein EB796_000683 [Bugula neritina]|uniref:Large ribosomal subunit protein uL23m n=1 Tax=Bugula neritina TaxID=10212 RepID=A0A7J7KRY6_BUGNE|nr:hypothetical protein EB796_000683 [Bugula neritina]